jgi:transposase
MQASTLGTPTIGHCGTIFVAIELSQRSWLVTLHSPDRDRISRHQFAGGERLGFGEAGSALTHATFRSA